MPFAARKELEEAFQEGDDDDDDDDDSKFLNLNEEDGTFGSTVPSRSRNT